jgi:heat shock protein HslJ
LKLGVQRLRTFLVAGLLTATIALTGGCASEEGGQLAGPTWHLITLTTVEPNFMAPVDAADRAKYTITFNDDGTFEAQADCNKVAGTYTIQGQAILTIVPGPSTLAACPEPSLGDEYVNALSTSSSYTITGDQMTITLDDNGTLGYQDAAG